MASIWITVCIALHNFALAHEHEGYEEDNFFIEGRQILLDEQENGGQPPVIDPGFDAQVVANEVQAGKAKRELIKQWLFEN